MAYNRSIPQSTDLISNSQSQILGNFQAIDSGTTGTGAGFSRNHVTLTDATNGGLHNRIDFYQALASPAISGFVSALYPKTVTNIELFYKNGTQDMQLSNSLLAAASGQGMLPGGLQIRTGTVTGFNANNADHDVFYSLAFPNATIVIMTTAHNSDYTHPVQTSGILNDRFSAKSAEGGTLNFTYVAIGR